MRRTAIEVTPHLLAEASLVEYGAEYHVDLRIAMVEQVLQFDFGYL